MPELEISERSDSLYISYYKKNASFKLYLDDWESGRLDNPGGRPVKDGIGTDKRLSGVRIKLKAGKVDIGAKGDYTTSLSSVSISDQDMEKIIKAIRQYFNLR